MAWGGGRVGTLCSLRCHRRDWLGAAEESGSFLGAGRPPDGRSQQPCARRMVCPPEASPELSDSLKRAVLFCRLKSKDSKAASLLFTHEARRKDLGPARWGVGNPLWPMQSRGGFCFAGRAQDHDGVHPRCDRQRLYHRAGECTAVRPPGPPGSRHAGVSTSVPDRPRWTCRGRAEARTLT